MFAVVEVTSEEASKEMGYLGVSYLWRWIGGGVCEQEEKMRARADVEVAFSIRYPLCMCVYSYTARRLPLITLLAFISDLGRKDGELPKACSSNQNCRKI
jgi:hypothetical protein